MGKIVVLQTIGTGSADPEDEINRIVPAASYEQYGEAIILGSSLGAATKTIGMIEESGPPLTAAWQAAFYRWVKAGKRTKGDMELAVPNETERIADNDRDLTKLARALRKRKPQVLALGAALAKADGETLLAAADANESALLSLENLHRYLRRRLKVTHVLASVLEGSKASYDAKKPVTLHAALINARTGAFKYYAVSSGRKGDLPADFKGFYGIMAKNLFEDAKDAQDGD